MRIISGIWERASDLKIQADIDAKAEWETHLSRRTTERRLNSWKLASGIAAAIALILVSYFALRDNAKVYTAMADNSPYEIYLVDGTNVWLKEGR